MTDHLAITAEQTNRKAHAAMLRGLNQLRHAANSFGRAADDRANSPHATLDMVCTTLHTLANGIQFGRRARGRPHRGEAGGIRPQQAGQADGPQ